MWGHGTTARPSGAAGGGPVNAGSSATPNASFIEFTADIPHSKHPDGLRPGGTRFFDWCEQRELRLEGIRPRTMAAYIKQMGAGVTPLLVEQRLVLR